MVVNDFSTNFIPEEKRQEFLSEWEEEREKEMRKEERKKWDRNRDGNEKGRERRRLTECNYLKKFSTQIEWFFVLRKWKEIFSRTSFFTSNEFFLSRTNFFTSKNGENFIIFSHRKNLISILMHADENEEHFLWTPISSWTLFHLGRYIIFSSWTPIFWTLWIFKRVSKFFETLNNLRVIDWILVYTFAISPYRSLEIPDQDRH